MPEALQVAEHISPQIVETSVDGVESVVDLVESAVDLSEPPVDLGEPGSEKLYELLVLSRAHRA